MYIKSNWKNALSIIIIVVIMMSAGYIYGFYQGNMKTIDDKDGEVNILQLALAGENAEESEKENKEENEETTAVISPNTKIIFHSSYLKCGDVITETRKPYKEEIGLKLQDIFTIFPEWTVEEFTDTQLVLKKEIDNYCINHYIIKDQGGLVSIYVPLEGSEGLELMQQTSIKVSALHPDLQQEVKNGIVMESLEQVEYLIESWQS